MRHDKAPRAIHAEAQAEANKQADLITRQAYPHINRGKDAIMRHDNRTLTLTEFATQVRGHLDILATMPLSDLGRARELQQLDKLYRDYVVDDAGARYVTLSDKIRLGLL